MLEPSKSEWLPSEIGDAALQRCVSVGTLSSKEMIGWRAAAGEVRPQPAEGEVVVFTDHLEQGFSPPGSKFFRDALNFYNLHPQELGPNSISNLFQFQVFCEALRDELHRRCSSCRYAQSSPDNGCTRGRHRVSRDRQTVEFAAHDSGNGC